MPVVTGAFALDPVQRQRAHAEARGAFARVGERTEARRLFETGGLRWRFPRSSRPCEAAIVNTGGGVAGGDSYSVSLSPGSARTSPGTCLSSAPRIGWWTVTSLVPSGKVASTWMSWIIEATPSIT